MTKEFVVSLENKPGSLAHFTQALGQSHVNITGIACTPMGEFGTVRFCTNNDQVVESWLKSQGYRYWSWDVITVKLPNQPGVLSKVCQELASSGVNVESLWGYAGTQPGEVELCIQPNDFPTARKVLSHYGTTSIGHGPSHSPGSY